MLNSKTNRRDVKSRLSRFDRELVSGKASKTLSEKLKSYSLFTTAVLTSTAAAHGQVMYTDFDPDIFVSCYGGCETPLDLNNDGITDYTIYQFSSVTNYGSLYLDFVNVYPASGNSIANSASGLPIAYDDGVEINSEPAWSNGAGVLGFYQQGIFNSELYGNFLYQSEKYLALRFSFNGEQHYGWVRLSVGGWAQFVALHDYAYETTPEQAIVAGDKGVFVNCQVATGLAAVNIKATSARLQWNEFAGAEAFKIRYKVSGTNAWTSIKTFDAHKKIVGLTPSTEYTWQVKEYCQVIPYIASEWSPSKSFITKSLRLGEETLEEVSFQIYPNPAEDHATIQFTLAQSSHVYIKVYDMSGKEIATLLDDDVEQEDHSVLLNTNQFSKGVYLVKMISDLGNENQKLIVQ